LIPKKTSGPNRIRKLNKNSIGKRNRYGRNWTTSSGRPVPSIEIVSLNDDGPETALWIMFTITSSTSALPRIHVQRRHFVRQYHTRRRATTSSSSSGCSAP